MRSLPPFHLLFQRSELRMLMRRPVGKQRRRAPKRARELGKPPPLGQLHGSVPLWQWQRRAPLARHLRAAARKRVGVKR